MIADHGIFGTSMSAIAERAGVGKPTIYIRWPDQPAVVLAALESVREPIRTPDTGSVRDDLRLSLRDDHDFLVAGEHSGFLRAILFGAPKVPALAKEFEEGIRLPRRQRLVEVLERGVQTGAIQSHVVAEKLAEIMLSPITHRMIEPVGSEAHGHIHIDVVDTILDGIANPAMDAATA